MAFVDELTIFAKAGNGGNGVVRWLHLKGVEYAGPSGGNGGNGGDVYLRAVADLNLFSRYRGVKEFHAGNGDDGGNRNKGGKRGEDCFVDVPRGTIAVNGKTGERFELLTAGETILVLKGGRGGAGNHVFKSSVNRSPDMAVPGTHGEEAQFELQLHLIADVGLIGLPNAGKSTLLNALTGASAKIGSYAFTTLEPNLGALYEFIIADIPGLIEDASQGKGLGAKFLKHVSRTSLLAHCVSLESDDPMKDYRIVRGELESWGKGLAEKRELIVLTKSDCRDSLYIQGKIKEFESLGRDVVVVSALDDKQIKELSDHLVAVLRE